MLTVQWDPVADDPLVTGYEVHYGVESGVYQWFVQAEADGASTDTKVVDNLTSGQTYYLAVRARNGDASLVSAFSNELRAPIGSSSDTTAPTVSIYASPVEDTYTTPRTVTVSASASDDVGVTRVEFYDGTTLKGTDTAAPYSYAWRISSADNGNHTWTAKAFDATGNFGTASALPLNVSILEGTVDPLAGLVAASGLVAAYGFEEEVGDVVIDASGSGNDGILSGPTRTSVGRFGSALSFDGIDDWVDLNGLDVSGGDGLTISLWMKADDFGTSDARLVSKATGVQNDDHYWMVSTFSNNSVRFRLKAGGSTTTLISGNGVVKVDQWHHVAATYDGARMTLFVDGLEVASTLKSGKIDTDSSVPAALGNQPQGGRPFDGLIDEVRIYNRALTAADIQVEMTTPIPVPTDTTAPTVSIGASPAGPAYTSAQSVTISATASDEVGVTRVEFYEGTTLQGTDTTQPYSHTWPISNTDNGTHTWTAKAFDAAGNVSTSNAVSLNVNIVPLPPIASFIATTTTTGVAPLTVSFSDSSSGEISERSWDFGVGQGASTGASTSHTYTLPGTYDVSLTVTGPGGTDTATAVAFVIVTTDPDPADPASNFLERGEIEIDHEWQWVEFEVPFADPIVIARPLSYNEDDPALVRIERIAANGFWIRVQEWGYLDGWHGPEVVGYLAMERGLYQLANGTWVEAGRLENDSGVDLAFLRADFEAPFAKTPVVFAAITSFSDGDDPVTTRVRKINGAGFEVRLSEEEAAEQGHALETVDYIAWEPSIGIIDGVQFEVGRTANKVTDVPHILAYQEAFAVAPIFLSDMQTANGGDTASLRWQNKSSGAVDVWIEEEQSRDTETRHTSETVGYLVMDPPSLTQDGPTPGLVAAYDFEENGGGTVIDASGNGNDGIVSGPTRTSVGKSGSALSFDGIDDWVDLNGLDISGGDGLTISLWMKADDFGTYDARLVAKATGVSEDDHYWMVSTFSKNSIRFRLKAGGSTTTLISGNGVIATDQWHHVAATYDGARMVLYVDGAEVASTVKTGLIDTNSNVPTALGDQPQGNRAFDGLIDEVRIYNRALTAGEL